MDIQKDIRHETGGYFYTYKDIYLTSINHLPQVMTVSKPSSIPLLYLSYQKSRPLNI